MTRFAVLKKLKPDQFRRAVGVKPQTFKLMLKLLQEAFKKKMIKGGRQPHLSLEDQLLMSLKYLKEYPTLLQLSLEFEVSESTCHRICIWVENTLIKSGEFSLPGKSKLSDHNYEVILVDVTESPIERPKKKLKISVE